MLAPARKTARAAEGAERYGYDPVSVRPQPKAGGSFATAAWEAFRRPVAVERIRAHGGVDLPALLLKPLQVGEVKVDDVGIGGRGEKRFGGHIRPPLAGSCAIIAQPCLQAAALLRRIIRQEGYSFISTHTSLAAFFTRLALAGLGERPAVANMVHSYGRCGC